MTVTSRTAQRCCYMLGMGAMTRSVTCFMSSLGGQIQSLPDNWALILAYVGVVFGLRPVTPCDIHSKGVREKGVILYICASGFLVTVDPTIVHYIYIVSTFYMHICTVCIVIYIFRVLHGVLGIDGVHPVRVPPHHSLGVTLMRLECKRSRSPISWTPFFQV